MKMKIVIISLLSITTTALAETVIIGNKTGSDVVTVRVGESALSKQSLPIFPGVSTKTTGSKGLSLLKVIIPPGASAEPHIHKGHESAIYLLHGVVETKYGNNLEKSIVNKAGDFIYIPPDVPHQPINLSSTEAAIAIVARDDGEEQEHVILMPKNKSR